jgi:two-component system response regulator AtoC
VRVICATNVDLALRVAQGEFREDLYYRINVVPLDVPPLRARDDDVMLLARHFAREAGTRNDRAIEQISPAAVDRLVQHDWPGNIRELRNVVERAVIMGSGAVLESDHLHIQVPIAPTRGSNGSATADDGFLLSQLLNSEIPFEDFERQILVRALERTHGNQTRAARLLGMTRRTLQYRIDKFKIDCGAMRG